MKKMFVDGFHKKKYFWDIQASPGSVLTGLSVLCSTKPPIKARGQPRAWKVAPVCLSTAPISLVSSEIGHRAKYPHPKPKPPKERALEIGRWSAKTIQTHWIGGSHGVETTWGCSKLNCPRFSLIWSPNKQNTLPWPCPPLPPSGKKSSFLHGWQGQLNAWMFVAV